MEYRVENHGSLVLIHLEDDEAWEWVVENVQDAAQFWGGALVVEPRYVEDLVNGLEAAAA